MKKILVLSALAVIMLSFTACQKAPSSQSTNQSSSAPQSSSASSSQSSISSTSTDTSSSLPSSTDVLTSEGWPTSFVSLRDASGETVLVEIKVPVEWKFDGVATFFLDEQKVLEIAGLESIADKSDPFKASYKEQYVQTPDDIPEGFGYINTEEIALTSCKAVLHMWKMWPDNSDKPWYPHCYFVEKGDYLVLANFYTFSENCNSLHKTYDVVLNDIEIFK